MQYHFDRVNKTLTNKQNVISLKLMNTRNGLIALIILVLLLAGGYWFYKSSKNQASIPEQDQATTIQPTAQPTQEGTSSAESNAAKNIVEITTNGFNPKIITVKTGMSVTWVNKDTINHQINSSPHPQHTDFPPLNTIDLLRPGENRSLTFDKPGTYKYHDHLHPATVGQVVVQ